MTSRCSTRCRLIRNRREPGKARSPLLTTFPFDSVFAVQETHPADPISIGMSRIAGATALSCADIWVDEGGLELWESGGPGEFSPDAAAKRHNLD